ncbi:MAG: LysR substrate-binding domain-containing protein [Burkholderiaceae bacterium]
MQDLNDMVLFAEVIEHGGFAAAGRACGMPKSRLSRRVARLEEQLGVQLMQRSTRKLSLTPAGEVFLRHCTGLREAAQTAFEAVAQAQTEPHGTVRLSCPVTLAQSALNTLLPRFLADFPEVRVEMQVLNRPVDPVEDGVDIALRVRAQIEDSATLVAKTFGTSRAIMVASPDLVSRQGPVIEPADLVRLDTVSMSVGDGRSSWRLKGPEGQEFVHTHVPRYVADDLLVLGDAAVGGGGAALLPDYLCRAQLHAGRLVEVLPGWGPALGIKHAVFPARRALVPAVRRLLDFLAQHLGEDGAYELAG